MAKPPLHRLSSAAPASPIVPHSFEARCPSCGSVASFTCIGEQRWSPTVAALTGLPEVIRLYVCSVCSSTISEQNLDG